MKYGPLASNTTEGTMAQAECVAPLDRSLSQPDVLQLVGVSLPTLNRLIATDGFPRPFVLGGTKRGTKRWSMREVRGYLEARRQAAREATEATRQGA